MPNCLFSPIVYITGQLQRLGWRSPWLALNDCTTFHYDGAKLHILSLHAVDITCQSSHTVQTTHSRPCFKSGNRHRLVYFEITWLMLTQWVFATICRYHKMLNFFFFYTPWIGHYWPFRLHRFLQNSLGHPLSAFLLGL